MDPIKVDLSSTSVRFVRGAVLLYVAVGLITIGSIADLQMVTWAGCVGAIISTLRTVGAIWSMSREED